MDIHKTYFEQLNLIEQYMQLFTLLGRITTKLALIYNNVLIKECTL